MSDDTVPLDDPAQLPTAPLAEGSLASVRATIGRYQIKKVLGKGGMGIVVGAHDPELDRMVAVKIIVDQARSPELLGKALRREAQALARLTHPNVISVFDAGVDGSPFLVMKLVEGETLGTYLARTKPPPRAVIALFLQAARGLGAIHAAGLIHRDFKPSNALVDGSGTVLVADLGLARIGELAQMTDPGISSPTSALSTKTSSIAGTPAYMAPEQMRGGDLTSACDQYSFCVALWEALLGERPPKGDASKLDKRVRAALERGIDPDPTRRFPSMTALAAELEPRDRRSIFIGVPIALAGLATVAVIATRGDDPKPTPPPPPPPASGPAQLVLSDARRLTLTDACDEYPSFGPDGTIYYDAVVGADSHLMALAPEAAQPRELTQTAGWDLAPAVSPDGTRIIFLRKTEAVMAAHVANLDDLAGARPIVTGGARPSWSPDGRHIWAGGRKGVARYAADTLEPGRKLTPPEGAFPMAVLELPDGRVVMLTKTGTANADGLAIYDAGATTSRWLIPASDDNSMDEVLVKAPDGDAVLVGRYTVTSNMEIWRIPLDGSPGVAVSGAAINARKRLAIAGRRLVWSDCTDFLVLSTVKPTAAGGTKFVDLARNTWVDSLPAFIPGTSELLFISYRSRPAELWRMGLGGENARAVPFGTLELDRFAVSHDGTLVAGATSDGLFIGPLDGTKPPVELVSGLESEYNATFTRDNQAVIFESRDGETDRIAQISVGGGTQSWVVPGPSVAPVQSPTQDLLAYLALDPQAKSALPRIIMLLDQKTGKTRRFAPELAPYPFRYLAWSPDGTKLLASRRDGDLVELELATGKVLQRFTVGSDQIFGLTYSGTEILVGRATQAGDIWEAELQEQAVSLDR